MKRAGIVLVFLVYLFSAAEFYQFLKFPDLVEHYSEHKNKKRDLSFLDFLIIHYAFDNAKYPDHDKDMKLPFKSDNHSIHAFAVSTPQNKPEIHFFIPHGSAQITARDKAPFISSTHLSRIWQPPKI